MKPWADGDTPRWQLDIEVLKSFSSWQKFVVEQLKCPIDWNQSILERQSPNDFGEVDANVVSLWRYCEWANWLSEFVNPHGWSEVFDAVLDRWDPAVGIPPGEGNVAPRYRGVVLDYLTDLSDDDGQQLRRGTSLMADEIVEARHQYMARPEIGFWQELSLTARDAYSKHYTGGVRQGRAGIVASTAAIGSRSLVFPECENALPSLLWYTLNELGDHDRWDLLERLPTETTRVYLSLLGEPVGATAGAESDLACFEISGSARSCHVYPIRHDEIGTPPNYLKDLWEDTDPAVVRVDDLQGVWSETKISPTQN